jgi:putative addiction module killer protein
MLERTRRSHTKLQLDRLSKRIADGVAELRIHAGPGYRVYFGTVGSTIVVLLLGGDKGTQARDIERAKEYWKDFQQRHDQN